MTAESQTISSNHKTTKPTLGLYIHIPFCETKCGYCDFYSVPVKDRDTSALVTSVIKEIDCRSGRFRDEVMTVFIGGGTPTLLPFDQLAALLDATKRNLTSNHIVEFTVEANPATIDKAKANLLVEAGVTRVSLGAQSFLETELETLERLHSPSDIGPSVANLRQAGIEQLNLDLIFGIPGQTKDSLAYSLRCALALEPNHLACYGLTYEPATRLTAMRDAGKVKPCEENLEADQYLLVVDTLEDANYLQYETSNFAKPGCQCQHNLIYWNNSAYIGVGPSAAGCFDGRRYKNMSDIGGYIRAMDEHHHAEAESEVLSREMMAMELVMMQLRLNQGLSINDFRRRVGTCPLDMFHAVLARLVELNKISIDDTHIALTREGRLVGDRVIAELAAVIPSTNRSLRVLNS